MFQNTELNSRNTRFWKKDKYDYDKKLIETKWTGVVLAIIGILLMFFGIYRGEMSVVFTKAINICMECIGIG